MKAKLKESRPLMYEGVATFYEPGTVFEVEQICVDSKSELIDGWLKVSYAGCTFDGWQNPEGFELLEEENEPKN